MEVLIWGARGSLPYGMRSEHVAKKIRMALKEALRAGIRHEDEVDAFVAELSFDVRATYGCNTSCVEILGGPERLVLDAGTGIRDLGNDLMDTGDEPLVVHILMTHFHWDHVQGFPYFRPAYVPGNQIHIYGFHEHLEQAFDAQQQPWFYPVPLEAMAADVQFHLLDLGSAHEIAGFSVRGIEQTHPGTSFGYRIEKDGKAVVYSTDAEHFDDAHDSDYRFLDFFRDADLLIFDAPYSLAEALTSKEYWGHSSNLMAVELAMSAGVKHLCLCHHEHTLDDHELETFLNATVRYRDLTDASSGLRIDLAWDGLRIPI